MSFPRKRESRIKQDKSSFSFQEFLDTATSSRYDKFDKNYKSNFNPALTIAEDFKGIPSIKPAVL
jgi:hypothetical protein